MKLSKYIRNFSQSVTDIELPEKFTFPFYYEPHPLIQIAAKELQRDLESRDLDHNFGLDESKKGLIIGKMFGVLVVKNQAGNLGYLAAFSGKLADANHHEGFVPPVFDMLDSQGYYRKEEVEVHQYTIQIESLEKDPAYLKAKQFLIDQKSQAKQDIARLKSEIKAGKSKRKQIRKEAQEKLNESDFNSLLEQLSQESIKEQFTLKDANTYWRYKLQEAEEHLAVFTDKIESLKNERREKSANLQKRLFSDYTFLNAHNEERSLLSIFSEKDQTTPPAGAGECSAPKLLHFAYQHNLTPIAMGEFWWGASPKSEVRNHQQFYPACRGKCEPILGHMLQGLNVEDNPMMKAPQNVGELEIVYEDDFLLLVNKPAEFLSVPGKNIYDSVLARMEARYPDATGPLLVHRLDMSTSGLLLVAKRKDIHKKLQSQFLRRTITKRYEALLDGEIESDSGIIELPLRVDLDNRPQQLVCYEYGKKAVTKWEKNKVIDGKTLVNFYPITGRTHQLRVHAAHAKGLNTPIIGDDLYGTRANRLHLHAAYLQLEHPITHETLEFYLPSGFDAE